MEELRHIPIVVYRTSRDEAIMSWQPTRLERICLVPIELILRFSFWFDPIEGRQYA